MTSTTLSRRSALRGAAFSTVAAAIPASIATAISAAPAIAGAGGVVTSSAAPDPIFALIAKRDQLRILARAADARVAEIERPLGPVADFSRPEFAPMAKGNSYDQAKDGKEISREEIEESNANAEHRALISDVSALMAVAAESMTLARQGNAVAAADVLTAAGERLRGIQIPSRVAKAELRQARREGKALLAWWDAEHARLKPALDAYELHRAAAEEGEEEREELWGRFDDLTAEITTTLPVTLAGAMALLGEAVRQINVDHSDHEGNVDTGEIEIGENAVISAYTALVRLLPRSAVRS